MGNPHLITSLFTNRHTAPGLAISVLVLVVSLAGGHFAWADQAGQITGKQLHEAADANDFTTAETLIAGGADIDARDENGLTPLMYALREHALETAVLLINHGASVAARDFHKNWTPLHYAAYYYRMPDIAELLINHGASVTARDTAGWTPLHYALTGGLYIGDDFRTVLTLLERGAPVDAETTVSGWKPLHMAVWLRDQAIVMALIKHGANVNAEMMLGGVTPLHLALHQLKVIPDQARQSDWSQARLEEQLKAADEVVAVLRAAGAVDRVDKTAFPRIISNGWFEEKRFETYPQPHANIRFSIFEIPPFSIKGSFTAKGGDERLISEPIGYVDGFSLFGFASMTGILDNEGRMNYQWVADASVDEPELCFDALSGLDHVRLRLHPLGSANHPYSIYMYYDADSGQLVEGFDDNVFGERTAEPREDGVCNWRKAKEAVTTYKNVFPKLQVGRTVSFDPGASVILPTRTIERATAEASMAALRELPSDVAEVSRSLETPRWEIVKASRAYHHRYHSHNTGVLLVRNKEQDNWLTILDCPYTDIKELRDSTLLFAIADDCDRAGHYWRVMLDLISMQAIVVWPDDDCESIDDCVVEVPYDAGELDCVQVDEGNIPAMDGNTWGGEMVLIPGGTFRMGDLSGEGSDAEEPVHSVSVPAFRLGKYEVTFAQWDACVADGGCDDYSPNDIGWGRCNRPVTPVSWNDAHSFIAWLNARTGGNYRLPTEAEWEYAARAGSTTKYSWGDDIGENRANCNNKECGDHWYYTAPVGSFAPNAWGLHDMHGNVSEWVQDCWNKSYAGAPNDGSAWTSGNCGYRVIRGGSWDDHPRRLSSAFRFGRPRTSRVWYSDVGFRLAQDP